MKPVSNRLVSFCAAIFLIAGSSSAMADQYQAPILHVQDLSGETGSFCLDSMETVPFSDDLEPTLVSVGGACSMPEGTISI